MKRIRGYVREIPGGNPVAAVPVTVINKATGLPVPVGGVIGASANPTSTDGNGSFLWTTELSPGPVKVEADISGTEVKVRDGEEMMQSGSFFLSDLDELFLVFTTGVLSGVLSQFSATPAGGTREVTLGTGRAFMLGLPFGTDTTRNFVFDANGSMATRYDLIVAQQWITGAEEGRQSLAVVKGVANVTEPTINTNPDILEFPLWRAQIANGASVVTVVDKRVYAGVATLPEPFVKVGNAVFRNTALGSFLIENNAGLDLIKFDSTDGTRVLNFTNGTSLDIYSDNGTVRVFRVDGTTGNLILAGAVTVTNAELARLAGVTSNIQAQLNGKAASSHTHAQSDITNLATDLATKAPTSTPTFSGQLTSGGKILASGEVEIDGALNHDGSTVGFYGVTPVVRPAAPPAISSALVGATWGAGEQAVVDSSRSALNDLIAKLRTQGIIT